MKILVLGHSFVISFKAFLQNQYVKSGENISFEAFVARYLKVGRLVSEVHLHGVSGGKITENLHLPVRKLKDTRPGIVIFDAGSNDAAKLLIDIGEIVFQIKAHAEALRDLWGVREVILCSLTNRDIGMNMPHHLYADRIYAINGMLKDYCANEPQIRYHSHPGFWRTPEGALADTTAYSFDGIHPNRPEGRKKYQKSLTTAIHVALKDVRDLSIRN